MGSGALLALRSIIRKRAIEFRRLCWVLSDHVSTVVDAKAFRLLSAAV